MNYKVLVEIPMGSNIKYEINERTHELEVDRILHTAFVFPFNYGYIQATLGEDKDPVDSIVLTSVPLHPGVVIKCHPIGHLEMEDEGGVDTKIISVPDLKIDPLFGAWQDIDDVPDPTKAKIKHFFENYKTLEPGKWVKLKDFQPAAKAQAIISASQI